VDWHGSYKHLLSLASFRSHRRDGDGKFNLYHYCTTIVRRS